MRITFPKSKGGNSWIAILSISLMVWLTSSQGHAREAMAGSIENGKTLTEMKCERCHGVDGVSDDPDTPHLAGQNAIYLIKQMKDYKSRAREDRNMYKRVRKLDEQQMVDIALWYESLSLPELEPQVIGNLKAPELVTVGDPARSIPPCVICHGKDGKTPASEVPVIAGQYVDYLVFTMESFRDGSRSNDPGGAIQVIFQKLSDVEIEALARYYAALGGRPAD